MRCRTAAVGGGYVIDGTSADWQVYIDAPLNKTTWLAELVNNGSQPLSYSAYAVCAETVAGKKGVTGYTTTVVNTTVSVAANETGEADAICPTGDVLTGGGYEVANVSSSWSIYLDAPTAAGTWTAEIDNEVPLTTSYTSFAMCLAKTNSKPVTALAAAQRRRRRYRAGELRSECRCLLRRSRGAARGRRRDGFHSARTG